ncbi:TetR/AcrR family transcriptional regulator C-terminal domain-containing protein [Mycetocola saprophilus]|uniref:TetR/AcrR family transcriptional regulator C-terminal domain-containing protein n=1 Tax=Mycetocola saprophilus TaxID=76636 RepID=UPI0004C2626A|nr:TetR/AcrR family transcriptional regulator C-terminal domain-containing protein [Mycetocola saprophilus]
MTSSRNPRSAPTRHSREDVADAALDILNSFGLADLTMRRLAQSLDVQPSALYWHYENKQSLLAHLADLIVDVPDSEASPGTDRVRARCLALRERLLAYRDGAEVVASTLALGLGAEAPGIDLTAALVDAGTDPETAARVSGVLLHFILGQVSHEQQRAQAGSLGAVAPKTTASTTTAVTDAEAESAEFIFGVDLILGGLAARG